MTLDILQDCKKYIIQRIKNPGCYLILEYDHQKYFKEKIKRFERFLANDVEKCKNSREIHIGQVVAFKDEKGFHRARVNDIFYRKCKTMYWILLIDSGKIIETNEDNIYVIKNHELKDQTVNSIEIRVHGIQPAALDINYIDPASSGIFHLKRCNKWSSSAYKFVKNLFMDNPFVYVRIIDCNKKISGEIYYLKDVNWNPVSLSQTLCDKGFALFCDTTSCNYNQPGDYSKEIEERIPQHILLSASKPCKTSSDIGNQSPNATKSKSSSNESDETVLTQQTSCSVCQTETDSSSPSTDDTVLENINSRFMSATSDSEKWTSSSHLMKTQFGTCSFSGSSIDKDEMKEFPCKPEKTLRLNVCRIVLRNLRLFNGQKELSERQQN